MQQQIKDLKQRFSDAFSLPVMLTEAESKKLKPEQDRLWSVLVIPTMRTETFDILAKSLPETMADVKWLSLTRGTKFSQGIAHIGPDAQRVFYSARNHFSN